jgi:hypothetical protein
VPGIRGIGRVAHGNPSAGFVGVVGTGVTLSVFARDINCINFCFDLLDNRHSDSTYSRTD